MRASIFSLVLLVLGVSFLSATAGAQTEAEKTAAKAEKAAAAKIGIKAPAFTLSDFRGKAFNLTEMKDRKLVVVAFLGVECPLAKLYGNRLTNLAAVYEKQGVGFVGINSNQQDSLAELGHYAKTHEIEFPLLKDPGNKVADQFGAVRTPEVFILDDQQVIRYYGRIDDQYGVGIQRPKPTREDLKLALDELLSGKAVSMPSTVAPGCHIGRVTKPSTTAAAGDITYSRHIAPILQARCVECHRPGEIAPFALTDYREVVGWAETIEEVVREQRMPPWHADPKHGKFANSAQMPEGEKDLIRMWLEAGAPEGDPKDLPAPRQFLEGWRIPKPDQVIYMREEPFKIPATGELKYQYFIADPGFKEDKWIQAAECRPGNRAVVHHIIVLIKPPGMSRKQTGGDLDSEWLTATAPGAMPLILEPGMAKRVPAGSQIVFQMHYTPNGSPQTDRSVLGLVFADPKTVKKEVATGKAGNTRFSIPPGASNHPVEGSTTFGRDTLLLAMFPHMHLRGKSFRYEAIYPDGKTEILLDVPHYDFNWQNHYQLAEPKRLPAGTKIHCVATFDNSERNLANPDPKSTVRWGDQTWEEMMIGYFDMALADQDLTKEPVKTAPTRTDEFIKTARKNDGKLSPELAKVAREALKSDEAFSALGVALRKAAPQLDRMCLTKVADGKVTVERVVQAEEFRKFVGGRGIVLKVDGLTLPGYAEKTEPIVNQSLAGLKTPEFMAMSRALSSSMHVPVRVAGVPATVNFWSEELGAFPDDARDLLIQVVKEMTAGEAK